MSVQNASENSRELVERLSTQTLENFKERVRSLWDEFNEKDRESIQRAATRFAQLSLRKLGGDDVEADLRHIDATLRAYSSIHALKVRDAFWESAAEVASVAGQLIGGIANAFLSQGGRLRPI